MQKLKIIVMLKKIIYLYSKRQIVKKLYISQPHMRQAIRHIKGNCYEFDIYHPTTIPLYLKNRIPLSAKIKAISFEYITSSNLQRIDLRISKNTSISFRNIIVSDKWKKATIDISEYNEPLRYSISRIYLTSIALTIIPAPTSNSINFKIKNIHLRPFNEDEESRLFIRKSYKERISGITHIDLNEYLNSDFSCKIIHIQASNEEITISGIVSETDCNFYIVEIPIFNEFSTAEFQEVCEIRKDKNGFFNIKTSRKAKYNAALYDRIFSRWAIAVKTKDGFALASFGRYIDFQPSIYSIPNITSKNKKGLGDFKINDYVTDLDELDISHITFSIYVNDFLRTKIDKKNISFEYNGVIYYADTDKIKNYDEILLTASKRNIKVYAIILICPENNSHDKAIGRILEHPEYDSAGIHAMPNLTNIESVNMYIATISFLASRYSRPDRKFGHIHRWIVHNEVDTASIWCNAGKKSAIKLMDIYVKSMRLIYYITMRYNNNSEVFISLSHNWQSSFDTNCYPGAKMLDLLLKYSDTEGDFRWGIAYHPHAGQLIESKLWIDANTSNDLKTKLITFENIDLLDKWIKQPHTFYKNEERRTMVLSKQNPYSFDYSMIALNEQAKNLTCVLQKIKKCDGIEAYIAHSWIDSRKEGGLKTGIRKYLDDPDDPGGKKPAWYVFKSQ